MRSPHSRLDTVVTFLDGYFGIANAPPDPAFSRFIPMVYDQADVDWRSIFEPAFITRFNGLMLSGALEVGRIWLVSFPSEEVLSPLIARTAPGDLIFSHHPIDMRCGDPRGEKGTGFIPIRQETLDQLIERELSFYACHLPLDAHPVTSTSGALMHALGGQVRQRFHDVEGFGPVGILCDVTPTDTEQLAARLMDAIGLPYVDLQGAVPKQDLTSVVVIAGGAGDAAFYQATEALGADCLVAGEVTSKIANDIGTSKQAEIDAFLRHEPTFAAIGVSHAGSEFLVMTELAPVFQDHLGIPAQALPEANWWR